MAKPNKTVAKFRRKHGFPEREKPVSDFVEWVAIKARQGIRWDRIEDARAAYDLYVKGKSTT